MPILRIDDNRSEIDRLRDEGLLKARIDALTDEESHEFHFMWRLWARGNQKIPAGMGTDFRAWFFRAGRGSGKALALDTPIPTPSGWTTMGDLSVGDVVFDENGRQCSVTYATEVQHDRTCYRVMFDDGSWIVADADHRWLTWDKQARKAHGRAKQPRSGPKVRTTADILATLTVGPRRERNHSVPVAEPLQLPDCDLPVDPYVLGYWLGNGSKDSAVITVHNDDIGHVLAMFAAGGEPANGYRADTRGCATFGVGRHSDRTKSLTARLRALGLLYNKHVPAVYLRASEAQRRALLAGLMDSDGYCAPNGHVEFSSTDLALAKGVQELALSLGWRATLNEGRAMLDGRDCGPKWRVIWTPRISPFTTPRKSAPINDDKAQRTRTSHRRIVAVEPTLSVPVRCITVDSPSHLYLAGRTMIPTHNTRAGAEAVRVMCEKVERIALIAPTAADVRDVLIEGDSGLLSVFPPDQRPEYEPSKRRVTFHNGARAFAYSGEEPERLRGPQHGFCFVAGTLVMTPAGEMPIELIQPGDFVMTRKGARRVLRTGNRMESVCRLQFDGGSLTGTLDHPIMTNEGWKGLGSISPSDTVEVWNGSATRPDVFTDTNEAARSTKTDGFTNSITGPYRKATKSITSTLTTRTIALRISLLSLRKNIANFTRRGSCQSYALIADCSLSNTDTNHGSIATIAEKPDKQRLARKRTTRENNESPHACSATESSLPELRTCAVLRVSTAGVVARVFNLTVEGEEEYFANKVLVHNCLIDEPASMPRGPETFSNLLFGLRLGETPWVMLTGTPKPLQWLRELGERPDTVTTTGSTFDNSRYLAPTFIDDMLGRYEGTRLGRQELYAEWLEDTEGALFTQQMLDASRLASFDLSNPWAAFEITDRRAWRTIVAVDPPGETAECGIVVACAPVQGQAGVDHCVILEDASIAGRPEEWGAQVAATARKWNAERVVVESNQGGDMVRATIQAVDQGLRIDKITAKVSKAARAEPVSALFERGLVHIAGFLPILESQMVSWVPNVSKSPDRLDALVHAVATLVTDKPVVRGTVRSATSRRIPM